MVQFLPKFVIAGLIFGLLWSIVVPKITKIGYAGYIGPDYSNINDTELLDNSGNSYKYIPASCNPYHSVDNTFFVVS